MAVVSCWLVGILGLLRLQVAFGNVRGDFGLVTTETIGAMFAALYATSIPFYLSRRKLRKIRASLVPGGSKFETDGVTVYSQWNMVLDQTGKSGWGWGQASMITVDTAARTVRYNPSFWATRHWAAYVLPGARLLRTAGEGAGCSVLAKAFRNPDASIALVALNSGDAACNLTATVDGAAAFSAELPGHSMNTFVVP